MTGGLWIVLVVGGLVAGLGVVAGLSLPAGREAVGGIVTLGGFLLCAWSLGQLIAEYRSAPVPAMTIALAMAAFIGGYSLASAVLPQVAHRERPLPVAAATGDRTALLLLSDAETETYSPASTAVDLLSLQEDEVLRLGIVATPFLFAAQKARYRAIGGISPARRQVREIAEALERVLAGSEVEYCGIAWCSGYGSLLEHVGDLARAGYSRVVVVPLGVGESIEMVRAKTILDRSRPDEAGITVAYAAPLRSADNLARLIARRISIGLDEPDGTGVALVAHGQPETRAELNPALDNDETAFLNRIKMLFADDETLQRNARLAWADWRDPDVTSTVRHLAALGCTRILVCPACYPVDSIQTLLDVSMAIKHARTGSAVSVVTLSTWRDEPEVLEALRERAIDALSELDKPASERA